MYIIYFTNENPNDFKDFSTMKPTSLDECMLVWAEKIQF